MHIQAHARTCTHMHAHAHTHTRMTLCTCMMDMHVAGFHLDEGPSGALQSGLLVAHAEDPPARVESRVQRMAKGPKLNGFAVVE